MNRTDNYRTITKESQGEYREKGSKFLAFAFPVSSKEEVEVILSDFRKKYDDAYCLGPEGEEYRVQDDGEPPHTAGDPILGQIRSKNLTQLLMIVVRYFGGTKLGKPGLIQAYKSAAEEALNKATIVRKTLEESIKVRCTYEDMGEVMAFISVHNLKLIDQKFSKDCLITFVVNKKDRPEIEQKLRQLYKISYTIKN